MNRNVLIMLAFIACLSSCAANRAMQNETVLFPNETTGKWWIINSVAKDKQGKDLHFSSLLSLDKLNGRNYASCFVSIWSAADSIYTNGFRTAPDPKVKFNNSFPLIIELPGKDSTEKSWTWMLKRKSMLQTASSPAVTAPGIITMISDFAAQKPFAISKMNEVPEVWAASPVAGSTLINSEAYSGIAHKVLVRVFSGKDIFLAKAASAFVQWLDLTLNSGKQVSLLFRTDATGDIKTESILLWDKEGNLMPRQKVHVSMFHTSQSKPVAGKKYPLYFILNLPGEQLSVLVRPRMEKQEITANKNSFWMGAVEAVDEHNGQVQAKGNMYIFKL